MAAPLGKSACLPIGIPSKKFSHKKGVIPPQEWRGRTFRHILGTSPTPEILAYVHKNSKNIFIPGELVIVDRGNQKVFGHIIRVVKNDCLVLIEPPDEGMLAIARYEMPAEQLGKISSKITQVCVDLESRLHRPKE